MNSARSAATGLPVLLRRLRKHISPHDRGGYPALRWGEFRLRQTGCGSCVRRDRVLPSCCREETCHGIH